MTTRSGPGHDRPHPGLDTIMSERRRLIKLAYRLLGSLAEAEDAVQETYARWYAMTAQQQEGIENSAGWRRKIASRICLNLLGSARARRERYVGAWLPEPLPDPAGWTGGRPAAAAHPADRVTLDESVSMAFLVVLDSMTPAERAAFILHDVFGSGAVRSAISPPITSNATSTPGRRLAHLRADRLAGPVRPRPPQARPDRPCQRRGESVIDGWNDCCQPLVWTKPADEILTVP